MNDYAADAVEVLSWVKLLLKEKKAGGYIMLKILFGDSALRF